MFKTDKIWHSPVKTFLDIQDLEAGIGRDAVAKEGKYQPVREARIAAVVALILFKQTGNPTYLQLHRPDPPDACLMWASPEVRGITVDEYEKRRADWRVKQQEIEKKIAKLRFADEEYYITAEYLIKLASRAREVFESSKMHERRIILKTALSNPVLRGQKLEFSLIEPFDKIALHTNRKEWLPLKDLFCNQKVELGATLNDMKILFENLGISRPALAIT